MYCYILEQGGVLKTRICDRKTQYEDCSITDFDRAHCVGLYEH